MSEIDQKIRQQLKAKSLTVRYLHNSLGITQTTLQKKMKSGRFSTPQLQKVSTLLDIPIEFFLKAVENDDFVVREGTPSYVNFNAELVLRAEINGLKKENELLRELVSVLKKSVSQ